MGEKGEKIILHHTQNVMFVNYRAKMCMCAICKRQIEDGKKKQQPKNELH